MSKVLSSAVELFRKRRDPFALIESGAFKIRTKAGKMISLTPDTMHVFQRTAYESIKKEYRSGKPVRQIWLKSRQMGGSTLAELIMTAVAMCNENYNVLVLSNVEDTATWIFSMAKLMQEELEIRGMSWLKLKTSSKRELAWEGSRSSIRVGSAESRNVGISLTRSAAHCSELAYYSNWREIWSNLSPSIPYLPGTIVILESTANGAGDHFHRLWQASVKGESGFTPQFFGWSDNEEYRIPPPPGWTATVEEQELVREYNLEVDQLYWRRCKIEQDFAGDINVFKEKYPITPEEAFRTTGSIVFSSIRKTLDEVMTNAPGGDRITMDRGVHKPVLNADPFGAIEMWQKSIPGEEYVMYSDVAEGLKSQDVVMQDGKKIDTTYSTCIVRGVRDWKLCATMECRYPPDVFSAEAMKLGKYYNTAMWGIEIPGPGMAVIAHAQHDYPAEKIYKRTWRNAKNEYREQSEYGFRNDIRSKPILESDWAEFIRGRGREDGMLCQSIAAQAITYIQDERTGKHRPKSGCFSDLLLADMGCIQLLKSSPVLSKEKLEKKLRDYQREQTSKKKVGSHFR